MIRKMLFFFLLVFLSIGANAVTDSGSFGYRNEYQWTLSDDNTLYISMLGERDYSYSWYYFSYSSTWNGSSWVISEADTPWKSYNSLIEKVVINEDVPEIPDYSFCGCTSLSSIEIASSVEYIGSGAFAYCSSLSSIDIGKNVYSIQRDAFEGCSSLESINVASGSYSYCSENGIVYNKNKTKLCCFPKGKKGVFEVPNYVTSIGDGAFSYCSGLTNIILPNSVTSIGSYAFSGCSSLASINLPNNITEIEWGIFEGCSSLSDISIPEGVTSIGGYAFEGCSSLTNIILPNGITALQWGTFHDCISLESIQIPLSVTSINGLAFKNCPANLVFQNTVPPTIQEGSDPFDDGSIIFVPSDLVNVYRSADMWKNHASQILPIGCKQEYDVSVNASETMSSLHATIGENNLINVTKLKVSGTINSYDIMIMRNKMTNLRHLDLADARILSCDYAYYTGYSSIKDTWTRYATPKNLLTIKMPNSITDIKECAFRDSKLKEIEIPSNVLTIGDSAFYNCSNLKSVNIGNCVTSIGKCTFYNCSNLLSIEIPNSVTSIGNYAFNYCSNLEGVSIPNSVTSIGDYAFDCCSSFTKVEVPLSVTKIGQGAFHSCSNISSMQLPFVGGTANASTPSSSTLFGYIFGYGGNVDQYYYTKASSGGWYYHSCSSYDIPSSLKEVKILSGDILSGAFSGCKNIVKLDLPDNIEKIGYQAFSSCGSLDTININSLVSWCRIKFEGEYGTNPVYSSDYSSHTPKLFVNGILAENVVIPEEVTTIGDYTFYGYQYLKSIELPSTLETIGKSAFRYCHNLVSFVIPQKSKLTTIPEYAFYNCSSLKTINLPVSIKYINDYAFAYCKSLKEVKISSAVNKIGAYAFNGCNKLYDVYTYTLEPQEINQNTFSQFSTATLHVPSFSWYNYYYNTQWSQFLKLENFDEPYEYVYIEKDFNHYPDDRGIISGDKLEMDIWKGGAIIVNGQTVQPVYEMYSRNDAINNIWSSIISRFPSSILNPSSSNIKPQTLYIDIDVAADYWYAFTFPFDVNINDVKKDGSWIFRRYDGQMRADNGTGGWQDLEDSVLEKGKGYIFRSNTAGTLSIPVSMPDLTPKDILIKLLQYVSGIGAEHSGWNLIGNPCLGYYDLNDMGYYGPILIWNPAKKIYEALRPGDDDYFLHPFQAFFIQSGSIDASDPCFGKDLIHSKNESEKLQQEASARRRVAKYLNPDRKLINLTISDGTESDKTRVVFNEKQNGNYEPGCDAAKFLSEEAALQLYSIDDEGVKYAINERPKLDGEVGLGFTSANGGELTISASRMDTHVVIYDYYEDVTHDFADGDYTFTTSAGTFNKRFSMYYVDNDEETIISTIAEDPNAMSEDVYYDLLGRKIDKPMKGMYIKKGEKVYVK